MSFSPRRRIPAALLCLSLTLAVPMTHAQSLGATLSGRVFAADGITPRSGVTVNLVRGEGESVFASEATSADGTFRIDGAPAGSYALLVDTPEGAFLSASPLDLQPGANKPMALALTQSAENEGLGDPGQAAMKPWLKWLIVGVLGATGLYVINEVTDDESPSSSF